MQEPVSFRMRRSRFPSWTSHAWTLAFAAALLASSSLAAQDPNTPTAPPAAASTPTDDPASPSDAAPAIVRPLAIVPLDAKIPEIEAFLRDLKQAHPGLHILLVWYPEVAELHPPPGDFYLRAGARWNQFAQAEGFPFVDLAQEGTWTAAAYRDQIHPDAEGDRVFARILQRIIASRETARP